MSAESFTAGGQDLSRRNAIKYGSIGAGMLLAAPTILTLGATPASASGQVSPQNAGAYNDGLINEITSSAITPAGILVATVTLLSNTQAITASGWNALDAKSTASATGAARITSQTFWRYYSSPGTSTTFTFSWPTSAPGSVVINKFPTATSIVEVGAATISSSGTTRTTSGVTPQSASDGPGTILFCLGYARVNAAPIATAPKQTTGGTLYTYTEAGVAKTGNNASEHYVLFPAPNSASGTVTLTGMTNGRASVLRVIAIK